MVNKLTDAEMLFVKTYVKYGKAAEAYRRAFPEDIHVQKEDNKKISEKGNKLLKVSYIAEALEMHSQSNEELAVGVLREELLKGRIDQSSIKAADIIIRTKSRDSIRKATERWAEALCAINARVLITKDNEPDGQD